MPTENIASATRARALSSCTRPTGSPRKMVKPAKAPSRTVSPKDIQRSVELGAPNASAVERLGVGQFEAEAEPAPVLVH